MLFTTNFHLVFKINPFPVSLTMAKKFTTLKLKGMALKIQLSHLNVTVLNFLENKPSYCILDPL